MIIYLIRHGETTSDVENLFGGTFDDNLTEKGREQVKDLVSKLLNKKIEVIFSSPYLRAKETAEILKESLGREIKIVEGIKERDNYGFLSGTSKAKAKIEYSDIYESFKDYHFTIKGGEEYEAFTNRLSRAFNGIINFDFKKIAIITHGGPIRALFREVFKFGEFSGDLGDCLVAEIEKTDSNFKLINLDGAKLEKN